MNASALPILLVEDSPDDALLIQRAFRKANLANPVQHVSDGEEAVAYLSGAPPWSDRAKFPLPVFMLLDLKLPRRSGLEVLEWVRRESGVSGCRWSCSPPPASRWTSTGPMTSG